MSAKKRTTTALGLVLAAAMLALTACGGGGGDEGSESGSSSDQSSESQSPEAGQAPEPDLDGIPDVVAEVNGEDVTKEEFVAVYEAQFQQVAMQAQAGGQQPDQDQLKKQTADSLVDTELLRQEAEQRGISASGEDVDQELTELAKQNQLGSGQALLDALEKQGTSEDQARDQVESQILIEGLVADEAGGDLQPSEKDLRTLYQQTKQQAEAQKQKMPPFAKVRSQLEDQAVAQEQGKVAQTLVDDLRKDADITINL